MKHVTNRNNFVPHTNHPSPLVVSRLSLYRQRLERALEQGEVASHVFSHQVATLAGQSAALVRRDIMTIGFTGSPKRGYNVAELIGAIGRFIDCPQVQRVALVGVGNVGRALLAYFTHRRPQLAIAAAFDVHPDLVGSVTMGCRCYPVHEMEEVVAREGIRVGILAVPAGEAQAAADRLVRAGVTGILSFAPASLRVPENVYLEDIDMTMALETVAFFARCRSRAEEVAK